MSDFSRVSNFDPTANYKFVRVGADCPVLEIELNEMQQISEQRLQNLTKTFVGEGVKGSGSYSYEHGVLTITNEEAIVDGVPLKITTLKLNMSEGEKAYIQMWIKEVTYNDTLKYMGNVQESRTVTNKILDTNIGRETSRRMQIQYDLVKDTSQRSDLNPVNLYVGKIEGGKFILDSSLLKTFTNTKNVEKFEVTQDTTQFNTKGAYRVNSNSLQIFVDGVIQLMGYDEDYVEVNSNTFRFNSPVKKGSEVIAIYSNAVVSEERPNTHGSTHNASGDDPIDISDLADRFGVRDKLTKSSDVLEQLGHAIERGEPVAQTIEQGANKIEAENVRMEANIQTAQGVQRELKASCDLAPTKKTELDTSIQEAKHFIENLDGSQNLPQIRMDLDKLQNGLKSNQELEYEGTNLKCENTLDGRIEDVVLEGMTYHNLFPSTHEGKIVLTNATFDNSSGIITFSPVKNNFCNSWEQNLPFYKPNTTYTIVIDILENTLVKTVERPDNHAIITVGQYERESVLGNNGFELKVLNGVKGKYIKKVQTMDDFSIMSQNFGIRLFLMDAFDSGVLKFKLMILEGDYTQPNSYIPSYFEGIESVGEREKNKINTLSCGKNLCAHLESGGTNGTDGDFGIDYNNPAYIRSNYINVEGMDYLACNVTNDKNSSIRFNLYCFYDSNKKGIKPYLSSKVGKVPQNAKYCRVEITTDGSTEDISSYIDTTKCIVIQDKIIPDKFKPYKSDERELKLPFEGGLKGIPNGAKDLIYNKEDGCYVRQNIEKRILNGTENITLDNFIVEKENQITFSIEIPSMLSSTSTNKMLNLFCDKFEVTRKPISNSNLEGISKYQNCIRIHIFKNKLETQDVAGFKKWLQTNPVEIYYELATPIETKISDTKLSLDTYNALTYVFSNNAISPNIKLKVASNLGSIVQQNAKSINDLYKLLEDIIIPQVTQNAYDIALLSAK